jgi:hypothetical protein
VVVVGLGEVCGVSSFQYVAWSIDHQGKNVLRIWGGKRRNVFKKMRKK